MRGATVGRRAKRQKESEKTREERRRGGEGEGRSSFALRVFLPHSSCARRREKVNSDVEKQIRTLKSSRVELLLPENFSRVEQVGRKGATGFRVRAGSSFRDAAGKKKFCTKAICRG